MDTTSTGPRTTATARIWFVAAPIAALVARTLWTPFDDEEPAAYLAEVAAHPERSDAGTFLMMLSGVLLIPAAFALASVIREPKPRLARLAVGMITVGAIGMTVLCSMALFASYLAGQPDQPAMQQLWDGFFTDPKGEAVFFAVLVGMVGFVVLAVGLYRTAGLVPRGAAVLVGLGGATTLFTAGGPMRALLITAALLALAGFGWVSGVAHTRSPAPATAGRAAPVGA